MNSGTSLQILGQFVTNPLGSLDSAVLIGGRNVANLVVHHESLAMIKMRPQDSWIQL